MKKILEDVNLISVVFSKNGEDVLLKFADMYKLKECASANCRSVYIFDHHNAGARFPVYVGEVNSLELSGRAIGEKMEEVGFRFCVDECPWAPGKGARKTYTPETDKAYFIHMEGGEISTNIVCGDFEFHQIED